MPEETVTLASENERIKRLQGDLVSAVKAQDNAIAAMTKRQRDASTDELLELADAVRLAKAGCDRAQATINAAQRTVARLEWEQKSAKLTGILNPIAGQVRQAIVAAKATMAEFKVTGITVSVTDVDKADVMVSVKPIGPDVPKPPAKRGGGGGGGPRGKRTYQTPDGNLTSRELVETYGVEVLGQERYDKVIADPQGQGLSHCAVRIAEAKGFASALAEPKS